MTAPRTPPPLPASEWELHLEPPPVHEDEEFTARGVFGSPDAGTFRPVPVVTIDGVDVASGIAAGGMPTGVLVVDGLTTTQGREELLDQPTPAVGRLTIFDPSKTWATANDLRGRPVTLRWQGVNPTASLVFFRGRIGAPIRVVPKTVTYPNGQTVAGSLVELPLHSIMLDLANRIPTDAWPAEPMGNRRSRVHTLALAAGALDYVHTRDYWSAPGPEVGPVPAAAQVSLLDHITGIYDSCGADRMTYLPDTKGTEFVARKDLPSHRVLGQLWWDVATATNEARAGKGAYARAVIVSPTGSGQAAGLPGFLDGDALEYPADAGLTQPAKTSRVQVTHVDAASTPTPYAPRTVEVLAQGATEAVTGIRTASLTSQVAWNAWVDVAASDLEFLLRREGSVWQLDPLRLSTRKTGGFEHVNQAYILLSGGEGNTLVFLQRSLLPLYGIRPVYGIRWSSIAYRDGGWEVEFRLSPVVTTLKQHAISWEEIDNGSADYEVRWSDGPATRGLHESLTYEDVGFVGLGVGSTLVSANPDTGWDEYQ